jgi:hypothetical protein
VCTAPSSRACTIFRRRLKKKLAIRYVIIPPFNFSTIPCVKREDANKPTFSSTFYIVNAAIMFEKKNTGDLGGSAVSGVDET